MRWVKETLTPTPSRPRATLSWRRRVSRMPTGTVRIEGAVGISRLRSMASTRAAWGPRMGVTASPPAGAAVGAVAGAEIVAAVGAEGAGAADGVGAEGAVAVGGAGAGGAVEADGPGAVDAADVAPLRSLPR